MITPINTNATLIKYMTAIYQLKQDRGYIRVTDIALKLGLTKGSVSTFIKMKLLRDGYVEKLEGCCFLKLTQKGEDFSLEKLEIIRMIEEFETLRGIKFSDEDKTGLTQLSIQALTFIFNR